MCVFVSFSLQTGAASKRFGIDGDREAVPLTLEVVYNRVSQELLSLTCRFVSRKKKKKTFTSSETRRDLHLYSPYDHLCTHRK